MLPAAALLPLSFVLGEFAPISPEWQAGLASLLGATALVLGILAYFRRKPPIDAELVKLTASIESLRESVDELKRARNDHNSHGQRIAALEQRMPVIEAQIATNTASLRDETTDCINRVYDVIRKLDESTADNLKAIERAIGRIEGAVKGTL